jgi:malate dehydrogenase (quinone)
MSVPHLDIRYINNKTHILFGPFALFKLKLGKYGNLRQYLKTIRLHDIFPMLKSSKNNIDLMWYLIQESFKAKSKPAMIKELERFAPGLGKRE